MRSGVILITLIAMLALAVQVQAAPAVANGCLDHTTTTALRSAKLVDGLGLTTLQIKEVRARLATSDAGRNLNLAGIGLTAAQIREIRRRVATQVAAMNKYPLRWPCAPFKNAPLVIKYMKAKLIANGFRPNMPFFIKSPGGGAQACGREAWRSRPAAQLTCSECGEALPARRRVVCSERCRDRRFNRLHPEAYAARERAKVERRRERRAAGRT